MPRGSVSVRRGRIAAAVLAALVLAALAPLPGGPPRAFAHANYERSEPAFAAELAESPGRIDIWFSQQLFRQQGANTFTLTADGGDIIAAGDLSLDGDDRHHAFAVLDAVLPDGRYFVDWTNLSADDGDTAAGRFVFYVGRAATDAEVAEDRALADELLVPYPDGSAAAEPGAGAGAPPPPLPAVVVEEEAESGLHTAVLGIAAVSLLAIAGLVAGRGLGRRR
ncbi:MAG: copper resistance protein CopC [Chloroflexi bacterium]|nr:copper resistance protein CopC [Chloroflexota bacterium]